MRKRQLLINGYEVATDRILQGAATQFGARVNCKVGLKDALKIARSGLSEEDYRYALMAHFDFVVTTDDTRTVEFAVEFDEQRHAVDPKAIARDRRKDSICSRLGFPVIRINKGGLRRIDQWCLLEWLVHHWFLYQKWLALPWQERPKSGHFERVGQGRFRHRVQNDYHWSLADDLGGPPESRHYPLRAFDTLLRLEMECDAFRDAGQFPAKVTNGDLHHVAWVEVAAGGFVLGHGRLRRSILPSVFNQAEIAGWLADVDLLRNYRRYEMGYHKPIARADFDEIERRFRSSS